MNKGDKIEHRFNITESVYQKFIDAFNDRNPLHTNETFARLKGFNGKVMHGAILVGFLSYLIGERLAMKEVIVQSYTIQFALPVYMNDILTLNAEISDYFESVETYEIKFFFLNQENKRVARGKVNIGKLRQQ